MTVQGRKVLAHERHLGDGSRKRTGRDNGAWLATVMQDCWPKVIRTVGRLLQLTS
jgi:hypothetical protein